MFLHEMYPYSVRPDLRLKNALTRQNVKNYVHVRLASKKKTGDQGGILNIPFVERYIPTTETRFNLWIETVQNEDGRNILQLQYEQVVFFEFGFGDGGGTTSWPHIQVNTLRKYDDLNEYSKKLATNGFLCPVDSVDLNGDRNGSVSSQSDIQSGDTSKCPYHK
jgi:hypothetical protein